MATTAEESASPPRAALGERPARRLRLTDRQRDALALTILALALLVPLRGLLRTPGPPMEEGFMLVFPERVLEGAVPNRDFLHLYGPGSLWVLAAVYKVFGTTLEVERLFGLVQQAGIVAGAYFVARWWGRRLALVCGLLTMSIMLPPAGLTAFAWPGAVALGVIGIALGLAMRASPDERRAGRLAVAAGICFGAAFLYRLDLVVAIVLAMAVVAWRAPRPRVMRFGAAAGLTGALVLVQFVAAGFGNAVRGMVLEPVFDLRPGRRLPIPPGWRVFDGFPQIIGDLREKLWWPVPVLAPPKQLFFWFFANLVAIALLVGVGAWRLRRDPGSTRARAVLAAGVFSLGMVSQALQRPDSTHVAWVSAVSIGLLPIALVELFTAWTASRHPLPAWTGRQARVLACAIPVVGVILVVPNFTVRAYADFSAQAFGIHRQSFPIERGDRRFYHGDPSVAKGANAMLPDVAALLRPGDRLFVGPAELRKTVTSEAWLYYLFPEAVPGTYYIEMDPGIANATGSRLADDLRTSDVAVLSNIWREWFEPNESTELGDAAPVRVLRERFCLVGRYGRIAPDVAAKVGAQWWFEVYERCDRSARRLTRQPAGAPAQ